MSDNRQSSLSAGPHSSHLETISQPVFLSISFFAGHPLRFSNVFQDALVSRVAEVVVLKLPTSLTIHGRAGKPVPALLDGKAGEELQLTCKADATVLPFYFQWRIAGRIIKSQNIENPSLLNLVLSKELNGVTVECEVLHPALESPLTTFSTLSVTFPPHIKTSVNPKRGLVEGNNASLLCEALANPPATSIIWKKMRDSFKL